MKLIDADKLHYHKVLIDNIESAGTAVVVFAKEIDKAHQVEAIPVEWLKKWFEYQQWMGSYMSDEISCKASDIVGDWRKEEKKKRMGEEGKE